MTNQKERSGLVDKCVRSASTRVFALLGFHSQRTLALAKDTDLGGASFRRGLSPADGNRNQNSLPFLPRARAQSHSDGARARNRNPLRNKPGSRMMRGIDYEHEHRCAEHEHGVQELEAVLGAVSRFAFSASFV